MFYIIPFIIIILSLAIIIVIIIRKFSELRLVDIATIAKEQQKEIKKKIILEKIKRNFTGRFFKIILYFRPFWQGLYQKFKKIFIRIKELEKYYEKKEETLKPEEFKEEKITVLLAEAQELFKKEELVLAEKKYIEVVSQEVKNVKAYRGLAQIYFEQKNYDHAEETIKYLLKLDSLDDEGYFTLGLIKRAKGEDKASFIYFKKAVAISPNNPRYLDMLIEISILLGNKTQAKKAYQALKQVNPENQKLEEFKEKINEI